MKNLITFTVILILCFPLAFISCQGSTNQTPIPVPTRDLFSSIMKSDAPDKIVLTPGGPSYLADTSSANNTNQWPAVEITQTVLAIGSKQAHVAYRKSIETRAGETRNNIINVFMTTASVSSLSLYTVSLTPGISLTDGMQSRAPLSWSSVLVVNVSENVSRGQYSFKIGLKINDVDFGTLPCTIKVIK